MPELLREATPKARKRHCCSLCHGPIDPGYTYCRATLAYDGTVYDWLECAACLEDAIADAVWRWCFHDGIDSDCACEWANEVVDDTDAPNGPRQAAERFLGRFGTYHQRERTVHD
ncbi:hypothetical protein M3G03_10145 [Aestuariimicrobium sp. p3-SID1156]|uniref:hypothetical protein n=1 Tax=Aestuariimicrobium sp. p3-SID1156 TaxID=2916038 RepID=UPI00223B1CB4|nr:hypothetical protein [Aestuariimicrobium sp. p3-SID1156]MCT1459891.1 hypothetical protein [Aestuariimicrobium sp. p3-SID1156]